MTETLSKLIKNCVEKAIEYEFARREVGEDGHLSSATFEKQAAQQAFMELDDYIKRVSCRK